MGAAMKRKPRLTAGRRRQVMGHKGCAKKQKQPSIASNSAPSIATARLVYLWSWGPIAGPVDGLRSVKLDGTPVMAADGSLNYPGVKWQFRSGELNQERLEGVSESSNEIDVQHELISTTPYLYAVSNSMVDAVRVRLAWPQLQAQDSGGNINGVRIQYAIDVSTDNGPYVETLASEVDRKNITKYERSHRIQLPAGDRWTLRVRRITPEANSSLVSDGMLVDAIGEVVDSDQEYPLTAVSCVEYDAQQFGGDIAKIAVLMRGRIVQVPANYDPQTRTYATAGLGTTNGIWNGTWKEAWTDCPPWIFRDLALHPYYGLGDRIDASMIDHWSLYRIAQFCDQMVPDGKGGQEPRFTCNLYLQKQAEAWAVLQDLAAIFHGLAFWDGSQIVVNADMPQDPVYTYTLSQILGDGAIKYTGSKARDRHSSAMVTWDNPDQGYESDKEPVFDDEAIAELGVRELSVEAVGCTSHGQAQRAGTWALTTEQLQTRAATFRVGLDGHIPRPGQVIALSDPMLAGRANGGRVAAAAGRVVTLDRDIDVPTGARLLVNLQNGKTEARQVRSVSGRQITVMADFSQQPQPEAGWALDFDDLKLMQFYVRNITRPEWHQFQFEVIQHEPSKFDAIDYGTVIDDRPISLLPPGVQDAPAQVLITSHVAVEQGIAVSTMTIGWSAAPGAVAYEVEWRWGSRDWIKMPPTGELTADIRGVYAGQYLARVRAISAMGVASMPTTSMLTELKGKEGAPPAVSFLRTTPLVYGTRLAWGFPAGAEDTQRTEIWQSATTSRDDAIKLGDYAYPQAEHELHGLIPGSSFFYWARLVDRSGNLGPWFPEGVGVNGQASSDQAQYDEIHRERISAGALYPALRAEIEKISGDGPDSVSARIDAAREELEETISGDGPDSVNARINAAKQELEELISELNDPLEYVATDAYLKNDSVRLGQRLYMAIAPVPAAADGSNAPPNTAYWIDIGSIAETSAALASAVQKNTADIVSIDGAITAQASALQAVQSAFRDDTGEGDLADALRGWDTSARVSEEARTRATQNEAMAVRVTDINTRVSNNLASIGLLDKAIVTNESATATRFADMNTRVANNTASISQLESTVSDNESATASRIDLMEASIPTQVGRDDTGEGDLADALETVKNTARISEEHKLRTSQYESMALRSSIMETDVAGNKTSIGILEKAISTNESATASRFADMNTRVGSNTASISQLETTISNNESATATKLAQVTAAVDDNKVRIQRVEHAQVDTDQTLGSLNTTIQAVHTLGRDDDGDGALRSALDAWQSTAAFASEVRVQAGMNQALAQKSETLEVSIGQNSAAVQVVSQAVAGVNGRVSTMSAWKTETNQNGKRVATGIIQGSDGEVGEILLSAQRVAIIDGIDGVEGNLFVYEGGQLFINQALISTAFIREIVLGMTLRSGAVDSFGRPLLEINVPAGTLTLRGQSADGSILLNNYGLYVYDLNYIERAAIGRMT